MTYVQAWGYGIIAHQEINPTLAVRPGIPQAISFQRPLAPLASP